MYVLYACTKRSLKAPSEHVKSQNFRGISPQTPLAQSILWAPIFVFPLDPSNPLSGPARKLHLQRVWLLADSELDQKAVTSGLPRNGQNGIHVKLFLWPPRSTVLTQKWSQKQSHNPPKFQFFFWGSMPPGPHYKPEHIKSDGYGPEVKT